MDIILPCGKKVGELKVADLKKELAERNISAIGKKSILAERLIEALQAENEQIEEKEMPYESEKLQTTPLKSINVLEDPQIRKSSRAERYMKSEDSEVELNSSFLTNDGEPPGVRRSSSIRRSVIKSLGLENDSSLLLMTPAKQEKRISCIALRTRSRSRDRTVSISPERSRILEFLATPKSNGANKSARRNTSITRNTTRTTKSRRSGSIEPIFSTRETMKRRSNSVGPASARKPPPPPASAHRHAYSNRFALQHQKMFEKQLTLGEHKDRLQRRHLELTSGVSDELKRLATPKKIAATRLPIKVSDDMGSNVGFKFNTTTNTTSFKFGVINPEDYTNIPKKKPTSVAPEIMSKTKVHHTTDAKSLAKRTKITPKLTYPMNETRLEYLSTPKGKTPIKTPTRQSYVPHAGTISKYVDTTKLNDRELELAREAGLVRQISARKTRSQIEKNATKREELLNIRRKLNL